jgi:hypothetical protein
VNGFVIAAIAMLAAIVPCGIAVIRGTVMAALVGYEAISVIIVMVPDPAGRGFPPAR